jgi:hypothetical protein
MAWSDDFLAKTITQRLADLTAITDKLRTLRRALVAMEATQTHVNLSTRTFAPNWQGTLLSDIDGGNEGQDPGIHDLVDALEDHFIIE